MLEAKLVIGDMVFSIGSEFVENEEEKVEKQDCETRAFKRLAEKIKKEYPRLRIIISGDGLYASKPVMDICKEKGWKYIIRFKEGSIPTLYREIENKVRKNKKNHYAKEKIIESDKTAVINGHSEIRFMNEITKLMEFSEMRCSF